MRLLVTLIICSLFTTGPVLAAGGGSMNGGGALSGGGFGNSGSERSPDEIAASKYKWGLKARDKAKKYEDKAKKASSEKKKKKHLSKAQKEYKKAIKLFKQAIKNKRRFHQAYSSLGYALRKTGDYKNSLKAYNASLTIDPEYPEAIEYRGETYLHLGQLESTKEAYMYLFQHQRKYADLLMEAMLIWVKKQETDPAELDTDTVNQFSKWVKERQQIAAQTLGLNDTPPAWAN